MEKEKKVLEALTCPNCNGEVELDKNQEFGFCKYCGTKLQNTAIKKINAKVKIDKEDLEIIILMKDSLKDYL